MMFGAPRRSLCAIPFLLLLLTTQVAAGDNHEVDCLGGDPRACLALSKSIPSEQHENHPTLREARSRFVKACGANSAAACYGAGMLVMSGFGGPVEREASLKYIGRACDLDHLSACNALGLYLQKWHIKKDGARARELYQKTCDAGDAKGCFFLARAHVEGVGAERDLAAAIPHYAFACEGGVMRACEELGVYKLRGLGTPKDTKGALVLLERACVALGKKEPCALAASVNAGEWGEHHDRVKAHALASKACALGSKKSCELAGQASDSAFEPGHDRYLRLCRDGCLEASEEDPDAVFSSREQAVRVCEAACACSVESLVFHPRFYGFGGEGVDKILTDPTYKEQQGQCIEQKIEDGELVLADAPKEEVKATEQTCTLDRVRTSASNGGHCCWPGQVFAPYAKRCVGTPQCPAGRRLEPVSGSCVETVAAQAPTSSPSPKTCERAERCFQLAEDHRLGLGENERDERRARAYAARACQLGSSEGCYLQALLPEGQVRTKAEMEEMSELLGKACAKDMADACYVLGWLRSDGAETEGERREGAALYEKACGLRSGDGCASLGVAYEAGAGVKVDRGRAQTLYTKACELGSPLGCNNAVWFACHDRGACDKTQLEVSRSTLDADVTGEYHDTYAYIACELGEVEESRAAYAKACEMDERFCGHATCPKTAHPPAGK